MKEEYKVFTKDDDLWGFIDLIQEKLDAGWKLQGGICSVVTSGMGGHHHYYQAMTRTKS